MSQQPMVGATRTALPVRCRYLFLLATLCGGVLLLLSANTGPEMLLLPGEPPFHAHPRDPLHHHDGFTIHTEGCTIPRLHPYDESIKKFIKPPKTLKPCPNSKVPLLASNDTHIWILKQYLVHYKTGDSDDVLSCCYRSFYRPSAIADISTDSVDERVRYDSCTFFSDHIEVMNEFVRVTCEYNDDNVYEEFFLFAPTKPLLVYKEDIPITQNNQSSYNVIIMGIDAISRLNFYRTMPKTISFLKTKGAVELFGYNKVADNTFPNLTPMLLGISEADLKKTCWPHLRSSFDNCPFVWEWFKDRGYFTALGEDSATLGTFNFGKLGFTRTPTDYYIHTFMSEAEKHAGNNKDFNCFICMGHKYFYKVLLDYIESLTVTLKTEKLFGFFWEVTMSHDYLNYPRAMDDNYEQILKRLDDSNYLEETILILLSDHGIRWGDIRLTKQGRLEERLPLAHILVPPSFRENYSEAYNNLKINSRRLVTPFDIHATLYDLANMESIQNEKIEQRSKSSYALEKSISLFLPIPRNRTCKTAGVEDHWCTCNAEKKLEVDSGEAREAGAHLMRHLNGILKEQEQCARLKLAQVVDVTELMVGTPEKDEVGWREYTVVVRASPGGGVFEGTLRREGEVWALSGSVSRLNLYGDQSRCVHHYQLKLYCYCL